MKNKKEEIDLNPSPVDKFDVSGELTLSDVKDLVHLLRKEFWDHLSDEDFCEVVEMNYFPLPFYSIVALGTLCRKAGLDAKIVVTKK